MERCKKLWKNIRYVINLEKNWRKALFDLLLKTIFRITGTYPKNLISGTRSVTNSIYILSWKSLPLLTLFAISQSLPGGHSLAEVKARVTSHRTLIFQRSSTPQPLLWELFDKNLLRIYGKEKKSNFEIEIKQFVD